MPLDRLAGPGVQPGAAQPGQAVVEGVADQDVGEPDPAWSWLGHQAGEQPGLDGAQQHMLLGAGHVRHQFQARRGEPFRRRRERHARRGSPAGTFEGTQQRAEQLPAGQAARTGGALRNGGEVGGEKGVRQLPGDHRLRHDPPLRAGGSCSGLRRRELFARRLDAEVPQHLPLERPGRLGDTGALGEQRQ